MKRFILEQSREEFYTSHSGLTLAGACINRYSDLGRHVGRVAKGSAHIAEVGILRSYLGLLCPGKSDYQAIAAMREDDSFKQALGIGRMPSVERLRQRLDEAGADLVPVVHRCSRTMLKRLKAPITGYRSGLVPLDVDVFPQDNSNTKKEGVGRTYKNYDGYAPIAAHLGKEGWCMEVELRPGSQHSQKGFVDFIKRVLSGAKELSKQPLQVRADAGNDALETLVALEDAENTHYIVKWNPWKNDVIAWRDKVFAEGVVKTPRAGKRVGAMVVEEHKKVEEATYTFKRIVRVTERHVCPQRPGDGLGGLRLQHPALYRTNGPDRSLWPGEAFGQTQKTANRDPGVDVSGWPTDHHRSAIEAALWPALPGLYRVQRGVRAADAGKLSKNNQKVRVIQDTSALVSRRCGFFQ